MHPDKSRPVPEAHGTCAPMPVMSFELAMDICRKAYGFRLFTILLNDGEAGEIMRLFSSNETDYPPGGRKPMGPTPWGDHVLKEKLCWLGDGEAAIRWAFPDAEKILSLGCQSCACAPIVSDGQVIGVLSLSHVEGHYSLDDLAGIAVIAGLLAPCLPARSL